MRILGIIPARYASTRFPGKPPATEEVVLAFTDGRLTLPQSAKPHRNGMAETLVQNDNVVSWHCEGTMYEADAECVGIMDGNLIWGRIYGWNPGEEAIGVWRMYPKPAK